MNEFVHVRVDVSGTENDFYHRGNKYVNYSPTLMTKSEEKKHDEQKEQEKKQKVSKKKGSAIGNAFRNNWKRALIILLSLAIILMIIQISALIAPDRSDINVQNVIGFDQVHLILIALSSALIFMTFWIFTRIIFRDHREDFGITSDFSIKAIVFRILILLFISGVFILLDVALINIYITLPAVTVGWWLSNAYGWGWGAGTDLLTYANIRSNLFYGSFVTILIFPALMFFLILTRLGRRKLMDVPKIPMKSYIKAFNRFGIVNFVIAFTIALFFFSGGFISVFEAIPLIIVLMFFIQAIFFFALVFFEVFRRIFHLTSSYILMVIPIIFIFYVIPVLLWAVWDTIVVTVGGDLTKTIFTSPPSVTDFSLFVLAIQQNSGAILRILELDFVIMIGVAAVVIGFAEGYSLFSIARSISQGQKITRAGTIISGTSSTGVRVTQSFFLATWFSMLWDKAIESLSFLAVDLSLPFDFAVDLPSFITLSMDFTALIDQQFFLPLTFLVLPALIVVNSLFKFLSVSIITQYTKEDYQIFFLLISSTFVLIIIKIYSDIASISTLQGPFSQLIPFSSLSSSNLLIFSVKVFSNLEAFAFFAGLFTVIYRGIFKRSDEEKE